MSGSPSRTRAFDGPGGLAAVAAHYDALLGQAPITARWDWVSTWARTHPGWRPLTVVVDGDDGPDGIALLAHRRRGPLVDVTAVGHGQSDYARFPARSAAVALLAEGICAAIRRLPGPRRVRLDGFPAGDPVLELVSRLLPGARLLEGDGAPVVRLLPGCDPLTEGRREARVMARRGRNRLRTDGRGLTIELTCDRAGVVTLLPEIEELHRARDHAVRGSSDLDDPENLAFWWALCTEGADRDELELSTMRVDGKLAAYLLAFRDGSSYRVWDPRISPAHARYNPGHVLRAEVLSRVGACGAFDEFDWMRGVERYKLTTTSVVVPTQRLLAWSPAWVHRVEPVLRGVRAKVAAARGPKTGSAPPSATPAGPAPNSTLPVAPPRSAVLAELVDAAASGPVLVVGSLPPYGRDVDLLVTGEEADHLAKALEATDFSPAPAGWLRWTPVDGRIRVDAVELLTVGEWGLPAAEQEWLWAGALPLTGHKRLHRPAPAVALLILARRYAAAGAALRTSWAERIDAELRTDPGAWDEALAHADPWRVTEALRTLRAHVAGTPPTTTARYRVARERDGTSAPLPLHAIRRVFARPARRRPAVVALSGLDGAGKTTQAALLVSALQDLGLNAAPGWSRLAYREWMWALDRGIGAVVQLARRSGATPPGPSTSTDPPRPHRDLRRRYPVLTWGWAWIVTLDAVVAQRKLIRSRRDADIVVCDRYALDSAVHLHGAYGETVDVRPHAAAVRRLLPRPLAAFLLRIEPTAAQARKPDDHPTEQLEQQARLYDREVHRHDPTIVLDASRPATELAAQVAQQVHRLWAG